MKIYDMHIHAKATDVTPDLLLEKMDNAGVFGGAVFSNRPIEIGKTGTDFKNRIEEVFDWSKDHEDRIFPVLWIHPYEKDAIRNVRIAVDMGIKAFKIICNNFYAYERKSIKLLEEIAKHNKPVIFHSGILWNGGETSRYNRPANFEKLIEIDNLTFSLGHCSWPWIDECIALYGKFLNATTTGANTEMFFDITPGTPVIYREELLFKLFNVGYDVPNNIMFGTDNRADTYNSVWAQKWITLDNSIYEKLGVPECIKQKIYCDNFLRFFGLKDKDFEHISPVSDQDNAWSLDNYKQ
ncbi:MAG: amidohydrolase family protein [Clostridia bacterium]|nr:amidohydrolase family protein [Clostridia bacterium]